MLIHDLTMYGDTVYAGISNSVELAEIFTDVGLNFTFDYGEMHFNYAKEGPEGNIRRRQYAKKLYNEV